MDRKLIALQVLPIAKVIRQAEEEFDEDLRYLLEKFDVPTDSMEALRRWVDEYDWDETGQPRDEQADKAVGALELILHEMDEEANS